MRDGISRGYYADGTLKVQWQYVDGQPEGIARKYYAGGELESETPYREGVPEGTGRTFRLDGSLQSADVFTGGKLVLRRAYDSSGSLQSEELYPDEVG